MTQSKCILVTGGAGFIGHHLVRALVIRGHRVRVLDDLSSGRLDRLAGLRGQFEFIQGSILDGETLSRAVEGVELLYHQAAWVSVPRSVQQPLHYQQVNEVGTLRVLEAARAAGTKRIIYAASSSAYGNQPVLPKRESQQPMPISPYAVTKYAGELYLTVYSKVYGMETLSLRYFNVFGPSQDPKSQYGAAIPSIVSRMLRGEAPIIFGDGQQTRDFCFVENVVRANLLAAEAPGLQGQVVNIACGQRIALMDVVDRTNEILGTRIQSRHEPSRPGDVRDSLADISMARELLGYEPAVYFLDGLKRSIDYYKSLVA